MSHLVGNPENRFVTHLVYTNRQAHCCIWGLRHSDRLVVVLGGGVYDTPTDSLLYWGSTTLRQTRCCIGGGGLRHSDRLVVVLGGGGLRHSDRLVVVLGVYDTPTDSLLYWGGGVYDTPTDSLLYWGSTILRQTRCCIGGLRHSDRLVVVLGGGGVYDTPTDSLLYWGSTTLRQTRCCIGGLRHSDTLQVIWSVARDSIHTIPYHANMSV